MSYQKVKENYQIIAKDSQREDKNNLLRKLDDIYLNYPKSFIRCPECYNTSLITCNCNQENYFCSKCDWKHINHHHTITDNNDYRHDDKLFMKGAISKSVRDYK